MEYVIPNDRTSSSSSIIVLLVMVFAMPKPRRIVSAVRIMGDAMVDRANKKWVIKRKKKRSLAALATLLMVASDGDRQFIVCLFADALFYLL
jgi:hypothetical protein